ncbi:MAG: LPS export ABC transporter permease LptF [Kiloniellales bacterium]
MGAIPRYILGQLTIATVFVTMVLTFAIWLTQALRLIDFIVNRGLPLSTFFSFVALLLPSFLGLVLPVATFVAVLFVYNKLTMDSELVVLRAAGLSQFQLALPALVLGIGVTAVVASITLYFMPLSYRAFKDLQYAIRYSYSTVLLQEGQFTTVSDAITVYVRERNADGELRGILVHDSRDPERPVTMMAERGAVVDSNEGPRVVMVNGNRQEAVRGEGRVSLLYFDRYTIELGSGGDVLPSRFREPRERYLTELFGQDPASMEFKQYKELVAEGHQRLTAPLYGLVFVLIALAALLAGEFNRRGQTKRILIAVGTVAVLEGLALALQDLSVRTLQAVPMMYVAVAAPAVVALWVLLAPPRRRTQDEVAAEPVR